MSGYVPLQQARAQLGIKTGATPSSGSSGGSQINSSPKISQGYVPLQQARAQVISTNNKNNTVAANKPTLNMQQALSSGGLTVNKPQPQIKQQSNPILDFAGKVYNGAIGEVGSILKPTPVQANRKIQVAQNNPKVNLPMGLKMNFTDPQQSAPSAQMKVTPKIIQAQKTNIDTTNNLANKVATASPGITQQVNDIKNDPFNIKNVHQITANPKKIVTDALNTMIDSWNQGATTGQAVGKDLRNKASVSKTIGDVLHGVAATANFAFSPLTAIFDAANKVPAVGTLTKLITLPFTIAGEGGSIAAGKLVDHLPISQQAKNNLKPAVQEIGSLAGQLILGHLMTIGEGKKADLVKKYGEKDANTIVTQATAIAKEKSVQPGTYSPQDLRNEVLSKGVHETPHGQAMIKASLEADQQGKHIAIATPAVHAFEGNISDYRSFGGHTDGTPNENAALRDITSLSGQPDVKAHTQDKVQKAIGEGTMTTDENGMVTLYRGGKPSNYNSLSSASYDKDVAQKFADNAGGELHEFKVKPEDIKAFIGKSEGEVLVDKKVINAQKSSFKSVGEILDKKNTRTTTEDKPDVETKHYDTKGKEIQNKKVLTGNQVSAVRDVIDAHMKHIRETSGSAEDFNTNLNKAYDDVLEKSQGDKVVLSALRTEINKEMYGLAGGDGNYKDAYKALQEMKNDPEIGGMISNMESKIHDLDNKLLSTPDSNYEKPAFVKAREKKQEQFSGAQQPVGTGAPKESRAYKRLVEHLAENDPETYEKIKEDPKLLYNTVNQKYDFENAAKIVEKDPQKAYNIAKQYEAAPVGQRWESVNIVLADKALAEKNIPLWKDLEQSRSLPQTRAGQGIVAERGRFNENSPHVFVQRLLDARMRRLGGETELTKAIDMTKKFMGKVTSSAKERAVAKIDQAVERAQKFTKKERAKIDFAQKLLNDLTCK